MHLIDKLQNQFMQEAGNSPLLLSDLASMETYIAESYQDRSIIELLQNADDAFSNKFIIKHVNNTIFVANDGRNFSEEDVFAICRSGASTKKRGGTTIGYRGIGFKSVVNLANRVHIISKDLRLTFSRELTNTMLNQDIKVPLIRIPHHFTPLEECEDTITELLDDNYTTIFIFENLKTKNLEQEIEQFDASSLLFLRKIKQLEFDTSINKLISVRRKHEKDSEIISLTEDGDKEQWLVFRNNTNKVEAIAFLLDMDGNLKKLEESRSVAHSFMPTKDYIGLPFKINGDFSTDPSRTKIALDDATSQAIINCCTLLIDIIKKKNITEKYTDLFNILTNNNNDFYNNFIHNNKFKNQFIDSFKTLLSQEKWFSGNYGNLYSLIELKTNPSWLNKEDFLLISKNASYFPIDKGFESTYPGLLNFLESYGVNQITLEEILQQLIKFPPSLLGGVEVFIESLKQYRFNMNSEIETLLKEAHLLSLENIGFLPIKKLTGSEQLQNDYLSKLKTYLNDLNDLEFFIKKLKIPVKFNLPVEEQKYISFNTPEQKSNSNLTTRVTLNTPIENKKFNSPPSIKKWRSVETNLAACLEIEDDITKVVDVSKSNLGYDLEVYRGNEVEYIEVKSVEYIGTTISLTNNEYSTANELQDKYILAIAKQINDGIEVCFIKNPLYTLNLTKRVTRWEWICDDYSGNIRFLKF